MKLNKFKMKRVLENDDDQTVHEWSQYFDNILEAFNDRTQKYFITDEDFDEKEKNWETKTFKKVKIFRIYFESSWCIPSDSPPILIGKHKIQMGYKTFEKFRKFMKSFLSDLADKLISSVDRNDLKFTQHITCIGESFVTLRITSKTKQIFSE